MDSPINYMPFLAQKVICRLIQRQCSLVCRLVIIYKNNFCMRGKEKLVMGTSGALAGCVVILLLLCACLWGRRAVVWWCCGERLRERLGGSKL